MSVQAPESRELEACRLCGFMRFVDQSGPCPACNAPESSFKPYAQKISKKRAKLLDMDVHPIMTHFAITAAISILLVFVFTITGNPWIFSIPIGFGAMLDLLVILFPIVVSLTAITGIFDGKNRYQTILSRFLKIKLFAGISLLGASLGTLLLHFLSVGGSITWIVGLEGAAIIACFILSMLLGRIGAKLKCNVVPMGRFKEEG
ncbi:hypothetical protein GF325_17605 [Candidatus Bathyarchaeota archaeon]|nr:hypothetical protein [Candidatus Bathyarchaeota archaeon]